MDKIQMTDEEFCQEYIATKIKDEEKLIMTGLKFGLACAAFVLFLVLTVITYKKNARDAYSFLMITIFIVLPSLFFSLSDFSECLTESKKRKKFLKKLGLSEKQATYRYNFIKYKKIYMPIVQRMCRLNLHPILKQLDLLKSSFRSTSGILTEFVFEREYTEEEYEDSIIQIKQLNRPEKQAVVELLFNISILEDGIHDDEWAFLMEFIDDLSAYIDNYANWEKYKWDNRIEELKNKYTPFRRSFADENVNEKKDDETTRRAIPSHLKQYYSILGLEEDATVKEIKKAYHALALQYHPDLLKNANRIKECDEKMAKIIEAYDKIIKTRS
ncbi:MAG: J domain-containing protein [Paludibacteraceae bacterium]|nr:J domain-containing protein [Paludibacteraceae bacterium]